MPSNRLEFRYSTFSQMLIVIVPTILNALGIFLIWMITQLLGMELQHPIVFYILIGLACLSLLKIPRTLKNFSNKPQIIMDEVGITDNQRRKTLTIPWDDIEEISFPYRYVAERIRRPVLAIKFKNPRQYRFRIPFNYTLSKPLMPNAGDYEISIYPFTRTASEVISHLQVLQAKGYILDLQIREPGRDEYVR